MRTPCPSHFIGLISGTSVDGIDAVIAKANGNHFEIVAADCIALPHKLTQQIHHLCEDDALHPLLLNKPDGLLAKIHRELGIAFASAAIDLLDKTPLKPTDIAAIGSHGQTVRHQPPLLDSNGKVIKNGFSLQIGCAKTIAQHTGITTVSDFRTADMEAGGQGAPLAPVFHAAIAPQNKTVAFLNLGGIANITLLHYGELICGYDTGPANTLMDAWIKQHQGQPYDENGAWAASGVVDKTLLTTLLADPWFDLPAPKSTGREHFHLGIEPLKNAAKLRPQDVQATLLALTAHSIAHEVTRLPHKPAVIYCCGGGSHNQSLVALLADLLPDIIIGTTHDLGIDPDYVEAALFAWLAKKNIEASSVDLRAITGANKKNVLGVRHQNTSINL